MSHDINGINDTDLQKVTGGNLCNPCTHVVKRGETYESIAAIYHMSVDKLLSDNHIPKGAPIIPGIRLVILFNQ